MPSVLAVFHCLSVLIAVLFWLKSFLDCSSDSTAILAWQSWMLFLSWLLSCFDWTSLLIAFLPWLHFCLNCFSALLVFLLDYCCVCVTNLSWLAFFLWLFKTSILTSLLIRLPVLAALLPWLSPVWIIYLAAFWLNSPFGLTALLPAWSLFCLDRSSFPDCPSFLTAIQSGLPFCLGWSPALTALPSWLPFYIGCPFVLVAFLSWSYFFLAVAVSVLPTCLDCLSSLYSLRLSFCLDLTTD